MSIVTDAPPRSTFGALINQRVNRLRYEWRRMARELADPAMELDADEFAAIYSVYKQLKGLGAVIDPMAEAFVLQGAYSIIMALDPATGPCYDLERSQRAHFRSLLIEHPESEDPDLDTSDALIIEHECGVDYD